jgi:hypothetical protein
LHHLNQSSLIDGGKSVIKSKSLESLHIEMINQSPSILCCEVDEKEMKKDTFGGRDSSITAGSRSST